MLFGIFDDFGPNYKRAIHTLIWHRLKPRVAEIYVENNSVSPENRSLIDVPFFSYVYLSLHCLKNSKKR